MGIQYKNIASDIEIKKVKEDGVLSIRAYALAFGNIDSYGDIIKPGACDKTASAARSATSTTSQT